MNERTLSNTSGTSEKENVNRNKFDFDSVDIDKTLLGGLHPVMSHYEREELTRLLVSGDPDCLATAAKKFHDICVALEEQHKGGNYNHNNHPTHLRSKAEMSSMTGNSYVRRPGYNDYEMKVALEKKKLDAELREISHSLPLPVRMPRLVVLDVFDPNRQRGLRNANDPTLTFVDFEGNGTIGLAFTQLKVAKQRSWRMGGGLVKNVNNRMRTTHLKVKAHPLYPTPGYDQIVHRAGGYDVLCTDRKSDVVESSYPMVLVHQTNREASKKGIRNGDVVTHVNGERFVGTAEDLRELIKSIYEDSNNSNNNNQQSQRRRLEIVVNADPAVAQALRLRSLVNVQ